MLSKGKIIHPGFWRKMLRTVVYFVAALLLLQDSFIIIAHTFDPTFLPDAKPFLIDRIITAFVGAFSF